MRFVDRRTVYLMNDVVACRAEKAGAVGRYLQDARGIMELLEWQSEAMDLDIY